MASTATPSDSVAPGSKNAYPGRPVLAVGAVVFKDGRVLLVKRGRPPAKGLWAIPGGGIELGETLQQAAEREIKEETGIVIRAGEPILTFDMVERDPQDRVRFHYVIVDLAAEYVSGEPQPGDDAADARWISARELDNLALSAKTRKLLKTRFGFGA
jgi:8-oxo-dGTP diphosphatase